MAFQEKIVPLDTIDTEIVICPAAQHGSVHGLIFSNITGAGVNITIKMYSQATGLTVPISSSSLSVPANGQFVWPKPINISAGDKVIALAASADSVTAIASIYMNVATPIATGFNPRGEWSTFATYDANDAVSYLGTSYIAVTQSIGSTPPSAAWMINSMRGDPGITARGAWDNAIVYAKQDSVSSTVDHNVYIALLANQGYEPSANTGNGKWLLLIQNDAASGAATSAAAALASETSATASASSATVSASGASGSATAASGSATAASGSATSASGSATTATTKASDAATSETNAATSETNAASSASSASTSATTATTKATLAGAWAETAHNTEVITGQYSAKHWAIEAQSLVTGVLVYKGAWDASGATYPSTPSTGWYYKITVAGTISAVDYGVNDSIIYNGTTWDKIDSTDLFTPSDKTKLDGIATGATNYSLPVAAAGTLGGIKIGSGLSIDGAGVVTAASSYTLPIAAAGSLGGIKIGSGLSIDGAGVVTAAGGATNIAQGTRTATTVPITSSTGTGATLAIADASNAGVMSAADKTKLDTLVQGTSLINTGAGAVSTNFAAGASALASNTSGANNVAIGQQALTTNTIGGSNVAIGLYALLNSTVSSLTAVGSAALQQNTVGASNTAVGADALNKNTTGSSNVAVGNTALKNSVTGNFNVAVGMGAGYANVIAQYNTFAGYQSGYNNGALVSSGSFVASVSYTIVTPGTTDFTLIGAANSTAGTAFTATGPGTGTGTAAMNAPDENTAFGYLTLLGNFSGSNNTALGSQALNANKYGNRNTGVGRNSVGGNIAGHGNTGVGWGTLANYGMAATAGAFVVGIGYKILTVGTTDFTLIGASSNTIGVTFTATGVGTGTGTASPTGGYNTGLGYGAIPALSTGLTNTALGGTSFPNLTTGNNNVVVGYGSGGGITTGGNNTILGANVTGLSATLADNIILATGQGTKRLQFDPATGWIATAPTTDVATLGAELLTADGTFTGSATGWTLGTGWAYGTNNVICTLSASAEGTLAHTASLSSIPGAGYLVTWTQTCSAKGNCSVTPSFGGATGVPVVSFDTGGTGYYQVLVATGASSSPTFTISDNAGTGTVTIDSVSVKLITPVIPTNSWKDSASTLRLEQRVTSINNSLALGIGAGAYSASGSVSNTFLGAYAGQSNGAGSLNTYIGNYAGRTGYNVSGVVAIGSSAAYNNMAASIVAIGTNALYTNTTGQQNIAVGYSALNNNTIGSYNVAMGLQALALNTTGNNNVAIGGQAANYNVTGSYNTVMGYSAWNSATAGSNNSVFGQQAGLYSQGDSNCIFGTTASMNTYGIDKTVSIGTSATVSSRVLDRSVVIGYNAGSNNNGNNNTIIGNQACQSASATFALISSFVDYSGTVAGTVKANSTAHNLITGTYTISGANSVAAYNGSKAITVIDANSFYFTGTYAGTNANAVIYDYTQNRGNTVVGSLSGTTLTTGSNNTILGATVAASSATMTDNIILATGQGTIRSQFDPATGWVIKSPLDTAVLGAELLTADGTFTGAATGWTLGANWAYGTNNVVCSTLAGAGTVSQTATITAVAGQAYLITFTQTNSIAGNGTITPSFAGTSGFPVTYMDTNANSYSQVIIATNSGAYSPTFTVNNVTSTGTITLDGISIKAITQVVPTASYKSVSGTVNGLQIRATNATNNTLIGEMAGQYVTSGGSNTLVGALAGSAINNAANNTALGAGALQYNLAGSANTAIGNLALYSHQASNCTAVGFSALSKSIGSSNCTAVGHNSQFNNNSGGNNVSVGQGSSYTNVTGVSNTAVGTGALYYNTASSNTALGYNAGNAISTGGWNVAIGDRTLQALKFSTSNVAVGSASAMSTIGSTQCVYVGANSAQSIKAGTNNVGVGYNVMASSTFAERNVAIGASALSVVCAAYKAITAVSDYSGTVAGTILCTATTHGYTGTVTKNLSAFPIAAYNGYSKSITVVDANSFYYTATYAGTSVGQVSNLAQGEYNVAIGDGAGNGITTGAYNVIIGGVCGNGLTTGDSNVIIGGNVTSLTSTMTGNTVIGSGLSSLGAITNNVVIGSGGAIRAQFDGTNWTFPNANLVMTSGKGIDFSATANSSGSMTSEVLSDYEEGTWTPAVTFVSMGTLAITGYNAQTGTYTKVGRLVTVTGIVNIASITGTGQSGALQITGLPFTVGTGNHVGSCYVTGLTKASYTNFASCVYAAAQNVTLVASGSGQSQSQVVAADFPAFGTGTLINFSLTYFV